MKRILVSAGDLSGINPYILVKTAEKFPKALFRVMADERTFGSFFLSGKLQKLPENMEFQNAGEGRGKPLCGRLNRYSSSIAYLSLKAAVEEMRKNPLPYSGLLTMPLSKNGVSMFIDGFSGHTEFLAEYFKSDVSMLLYSKRIAVCTMTTHIPLKSVSSSLSYMLLKKTAANIHGFYTKYVGKKPRMTLLCINPHCSDGGLLGCEDKKLARWSAKISAETGGLTGPISADTAFSPEIMKKTDVYISVYHDQGLIPFKMVSLNEGVNITAGLPFLRISPAHGPAYDKAACPEKASSASLERCVEFLLNSK